MKLNSIRHTALLGVLLYLTGSATAAEPRVERNVLYGMYSGLGLLMDVYHPAQPNGYGIIFISGSGWQAPLGLDARPLKESGQEQVYAVPLAGAGYTVFSINHRASPRFHYPAAVEDAQRAVRFVRHYAERFGIRPDRIGAVGGSSGGHLVSELGTLDGAGDATDLDAVNRESAKVQCVVARAAPIDLAKMANGQSSPTVALFLGLPLPPQADPQSEEAKQFTKASPIHDVTPDDAPFLLFHGDADASVPFEQSELMQAALAKAGVKVKLLRIPGGDHGPTSGGIKGGPDYVGETIRWFDDHLQLAPSRR